ncbi:MAG: MFS transporter [Chloroflexi bacterium]|nr:MFS transporter [Chloroflexota bacterium]
MPRFIDRDIRTAVSHRVPFFYGWVIVTAAFFASFSGGGIQAFTFGVFIKPMSEGLGWSRTAITGALTVRTYAGAALSPVFGRLVDRHGPRYLMMLTAIVGGIATLLLSRVVTIWQFYALFGLMGLSGGTGAGGVVTEATVSKWFIRLRGRAIAFGTMGNVAAGVILAPLVGVVIAISGWEAAWLVIAAIFFGLLLPFSFLMARQPEDMGLLPDGAKSREEVQALFQRKGNMESAYSWRLKEALRTRALWILLAAQVIAGFPSSSVVIHHYSYITDEGFSSAVAAGVLGTLAISAAAARIIWGLLVERYPVRYCMAASYFGDVLGLLILLTGLNLGFAPMLFLFSVVYGLNIGGTVVLTSVGIANYFGRDFVGTIRGTMMAITTSSVALGPVLVSMAYDAQGTYFRAFEVLVGLFLISAFVVLFAKPPTKAEQVSPAQGDL